MISSGEYKFAVSGANGKRFLWPVKIEATDKQLKLKFNYNKQMLEEIKSLENARWNPEGKIWTVDNSLRNWFSMRYMMGENVYERYDKPLEHVEPNRSLFKHQGEMLDFCCTRRHGIIAGEMGTGKTLVFIELMEKFPQYVWWYIGTKASIRAVKLELLKWKSKVQPAAMYTYDSLRRIVENWQGGNAPQGLFIDESSRIKNPTTKRSQMVKFLAKSCLEDHGENDSIIILASGSPAPKSPTDWWHQCEVAKAGYLKESSEVKLKKRLAIIEERESAITGMKYPHLVSWLDDDNKCAKCGQFKDAAVHGSDAILMGEGNAHEFVQSINEVAKLHQRMQGLVLVKFKKDCLDLPEKVYTQIVLEPSKAVLRSASLISKTAKSTIDCMIRLRELSDGFQYKDIKTGKLVACPVCNGSKQIQEFHNSKGEPYDYQRERLEYENMVEELESKGLAIQDFEKVRETLTERAVGHVMVDCPTCNATGQVDEIMREAQQVPCPKEDALIDLIEDHEDVGRLVVYAGFTGSIERICEIVKKVGWNFLRMDGKGVQCSFDLNQYPISGVEPTEHPLACFQRVQTEGPEKLVFVGHPGSAGMGLTLTASPTIVYWSNDFNAESRIQSEDRIHRPGMDKNRGATIVDLIHLETDRIVLENLKRKRDLQAITLGEVQKNLEVQLTEAEREQLRGEGTGE